MELSFGVGTLLKMCNEPRTIDFQARGLTGRDRRNILSFFFLNAFLSLDLRHLRVLFLSRVFYSPLPCVSFFPLFFSPTGKNNYRACKFLCAFLFLVVKASSKRFLLLPFFLPSLLSFLLFLPLAAAQTMCIRAAPRRIELHEWK